MSGWSILRSCFPLLGILLLDVSIGLSDDIVGKVIDGNGQPVSGARVDISTAGPKRGPAIYCPSCYLDCRKWAKTDLNGAFAIPDVDPNLKFSLLATATNKQTAFTDRIDPANGPTEIVMKELPDTPSNRLLLGKVVNKDGVPVPGALVSAIGAKTSSRQWGGKVDDAMPTVTDEEGDFRMLLQDDFLSLDVSILADGSAGALLKDLSPGVKIHSLLAPTGTSVKGRLLHNGNPAPNQPVAVVQMDRSGDSHFIKSVLSFSDLNGEFLFQYLPASEAYAIFTPRELDSTGLCLKTSSFQAGDNDRSVDLGDIAISPGLRLAGRLVPPDGEMPLAEVSIRLQRNPAWDLLYTKTDSQGCFEFDNLPIESYEIVFIDDNWIIDESKANYHLTGDRGLAWGLRENKLDLEIPIRRVLAEEKISMDSGQKRNRGPAPKGKQILAGVVVDRQGMPVDDVNVTAARYPYDHNIQANFKTSQNGKFTLKDLPDQPILLQLFRRNSGFVTAGRNQNIIRYVSTRRTAVGDREMRVIFDPTVFMELPEIKIKL